MTNHPRLQKRTRVPGAQRRDVGIAQHLGGRPAAQHAPLLQHDNRGGKPRDLRRGMADVEDRDLKIIAQPLEIREDFFFPFGVQGGQRFIGQDQRGPRQERAAKRHALGLAARQVPGPPIEQRAETEEVDDPVEAFHLCPYVIAGGRNGGHR
jgi:hypothetical protein